MSYLKSKEWFAKTEIVRQRNGGLCEVCCIRMGNHVHHRHYKTLYRETGKELLHVCDVCHGLIHQTSRGFAYPSTWVKILELRKELHG